MCFQPLHLAQLSTVAMSFLWKSKQINNNEGLWNKERQANFFKFCRNFILLSDITDYIVYTGLKYAENYLSKVNADLNSISEYQLFTVTMILSHKYHEDVDTCSQPMWEMASGLAQINLVRLEWEFLAIIDYELYVNFDEVKCYFNRLYNSHQSLEDIFNTPSDMLLCPSSPNPVSHISPLPASFVIDNSDIYQMETDIESSMNCFLLSNDSIDLLASGLQQQQQQQQQYSDTNTIDSGIIIHDVDDDPFKLLDTNMLDSNFIGSDDQSNLLDMTTIYMPPENWESQNAYNCNSLFI